MTYTEDEIRLEVLVALDASKSGTLTTGSLIDILEAKMGPTGKDADILDGRSDTYFSQKVRNIVSHRDQGTGLVHRGLVTYDPASEALTITAEGRVEARK